MRAERRPPDRGDRKHGRLAPNLRSRDRRQDHRLDLDVDARLIGVHLQEHVTDAQGRALGMGDDDLDLIHGGQYPEMTVDVAGFIAARSELVPDGSKLSGRVPSQLRGGTRPLVRLCRSMPGRSWLLPW
ncbi:hypothetical protein GCM10009578_046760 [Streptomyces rhizosphaericus]